MRIVITGSAGFIGRALVRELTRYDAVVGIDRLPQPPVPGLRAVRADLLDGDEQTRDALAHADLVFHLAGCPDVRDPRGDADWWRHRDNVLATETVLATVPPNARLVITSSSSVYGGTERGRPSVESDGLRPRGGYALSKVAMERRCESRIDDGGNVLVVRPFTVAGEGQRPGMALSRWITAARAGLPLRVLGSPSRSRDITDVAQVARALVELAHTGAHGAVNLGTGVGRTLSDMVMAIGDALDVDVTTEVVPASDVEVAHTLADASKLYRLIGWAPQTDLTDLVVRQAAAMSAPALVAVE